MNNVFVSSAYAGVTLSLVSYMAGYYLRKKVKCSLINPLVVSVVVTILVLVISKTDYEVYRKKTEIISWLLTPATVCLAVPLYQQFELLKKHWKAVFLGISAGVLTSLSFVLWLCVVLKLDHKYFVTLLPKSITTPIGMSVSEVLGGHVAITVTVIVITGILGNLFGEIVCRIFRITEPISKGIAIGTSSHALGTAKAIELGEVEGAMSSLSIAVSGVLTVFGAMLFANFL